MKIYDKYAENNGTFWMLCRVKSFNLPSDQIEENDDRGKSMSSSSSVVAPIFITSYLNTIHIRQRSNNVDVGLLNATIRVHSGTNIESYFATKLNLFFTLKIISSLHRKNIFMLHATDPNHKLKLISTTDDFVESCDPNPCQNGGKCIPSDKKKICQCKSYFTGRFCSLTMCELDPCVFGQCELTYSGFKVCSL